MQTGQKDPFEAYNGGIISSSGLSKALMKAITHGGAETKLHVFQRGEKAMRERAALEAARHYDEDGPLDYVAEEIRALPLSVADGPAPATEGVPLEMALCEIPRLILKANQPYIFRRYPGCEKCVAYLDPAPSPPTVEERVEKAETLAYQRWKWIQDLMKQVRELQEERAALLTCRDLLREIEVECRKAPATTLTTYIVGRAHTALAAADAVVKP